MTFCKQTSLRLNPKRRKRIATASPSSHTHDSPDFSWTNWLGHSLLKAIKWDHFISNYRTLAAAGWKRQKVVLKLLSTCWQRNDSWISFFTSHISFRWIKYERIYFLLNTLNNERRLYNFIFFMLPSQLRSCKCILEISYFSSCWRLAGCDLMSESLWQLCYHKIWNTKCVKMQSLQTK